MESISATCWGAVTMVSGLSDGWSPIRSFAVAAGVAGFACTILKKFFLCSQDSIFIINHSHYLNLAKRGFGVLGFWGL